MFSDKSVMHEYPFPPPPDPRSTLTPREQPPTPSHFLYMDRSVWPHLSPLYKRGGAAGILSSGDWRRWRVEGTLGQAKPVTKGATGEGVMVFIFVLWRLFSFTPIHSLTGSVGQLFASRLWEKRFPSQKCTNTYNATGFSC
jgi:hypothetical protein